MKKVTTKAEVRALLTSIDTLLKRNDDGSQALWNILTALRGPDKGNIGKEKTVEIRAAAFPETKAARGSANGAYMDPAFVPAYSVEEYETGQTWHFKSHIIRAQEALTTLRSRTRSWV